MTYLRAVAVLLVAFAANKVVISTVGAYLTEPEFYLVGGLCLLGAAFGLACVYRNTANPPSRDA
jgi:hypothetical protein